MRSTNMWALSVLVGLSLLPGAGCETTRSSPSPTSQPAATGVETEEDAAAGHLAEQDAQHAISELKSEPPREASRPRAPQPHTGTRVVDQPRVGPR